MVILRRWLATYEPHGCHTFQHRHLKPGARVRIYLACVLLILSISGCRNILHRPMRIAIHPWLGYQSLTLSQQEHALPPAMVQLIHGKDISDSSRMLWKNLVDAAAIPMDEMLALRQRGIDLTAVLVFDISAGADLLLVRPEIRTLEELRGKTIGMEDSALGHLMLSEILQRAHLHVNDISIHYCVVSEHETLWQNSNIDALITYLPVADTVKANSRRIFDSYDIPNRIMDVLAVRTDCLENFRPTLERLTKEHFIARQRMITNDPDTLHRLAAILQLSIWDTEDIMRQLTFPGPSWNRNFLSADNSKGRRIINNLITALQRCGALPPSVDTENLTDPSFCLQTLQ